ncbi:MAG: response regulator [Bacteroidetes bacterium]|nr:response regulator [Bacteroidota bacterium]
MLKTKISISVKIGLLLTIGVIVILVGGYFSYRSLSSVVKLMYEENTPQYGFITIKNITTSIEQAENNIRLYGLTKQRSYLKKHRNHITAIDSSFKLLNEHYPHDEWFSAKLDTINQLLESRLQLWDEMIWLWQTDTTDKVFTYLTTQLQTNKDTLDKDKNLFQRIFGSNKIEEKKIDNEKILDELNKIEQGEKVIEHKLLQKESELTESSNKINEAFTSLMEQLENYERQKEINHYNNAEKLANIAYNRLTFFSLFGVLLSLVVLIVIIKYIRKNKQYNDILISSRIDAEKLAKSKELFMAKVSHEIRTPLNAISGFIKQILNEPLDVKLRDKIEIVNAASDQLIRLINDVLDFTKLQSDKLVLHKTHFNPEHLIKNVCNLFFELAKNNENVITYTIKNEENLVLFGDVNRFQQILYNLLSNAVKFTEQGTIEVLANIKTENKNTVLVELIVKDNGLGIDPSKLEDVFQEYTQEDQNIATRYEGTGLGLTIVKKIVELFNGDIRLESRKGSGTKAVCMLRFEPGEKEKIEVLKTDSTPHNFPDNFNVLIADDEEYNRLLISSILDRWNIKYDIANNGLEAIELLKQKNKYDFILMDIRMPIINGVMATKLIRESLQLSNKETKVIGITADTADNLTPEVKALFNHILTKPFSEDQIYQLFKAELDPNLESLSDTYKNNQNEKSYEADLTNLVRVAGNDLDFVQEMIQQFKISTEKGLKEIKIALENEQYEMVSDLAHKLVPSSRHLGVKKLVKALKIIEENALNENKTLILELIQEAEEVTTIAMKSLQNQFQELTKQSK